METLFNLTLRCREATRESVHTIRFLMESGEAKEALNQLRQLSENDEHLIDCQVSYLMTAAFNYALGLDNAEEALAWARQSYTLAQRIKNVAVKDRTLLLMANLHLQNRDWHRALHCVDLLSPHSNCCAFDVSKLRLSIAMGTGQGKEAALGKAIAEIGTSVCQFKQLLAICSECAGSVLVLFEAGREKIRHVDQPEWHCIIVIYFVEKNDAGSGLKCLGRYLANGPDVTSQHHNRLVDFCDHFVGTLVQGESLEIAKQWCAAMILLCESDQYQRDRHLYFLIQCTRKVDGKVEAERLLNLHLEAMPTNKMLMHLSIEMVLDHGGGDIMPLTSPDCPGSSFFQALLVRVNDKGFPAWLKEAMKNVLALEGQQLDRALVLLLRLALRRYAETPEDWLEEFVVEVMNCFEDLEGKEWMSQILWNLAVCCKSNDVRFHLFGHAACLLPMGSGGRLSCRVAQLGSAFVLGKTHQVSVEEALKDIETGLRAAEIDDNTRRTLIICRVKTLLFLTRDVTEAVNEAVETGDPLVLQLMAAQLATDCRWTNLREQILSKAANCVKDDDLLPVCVSLVKEQLSVGDLDGVCQVVERVLSHLNNAQVAYFDQQNYMMLLLEMLWNVSVKLKVSRRCEEKAMRLKNLAVEVATFAPDFKQYFDDKITNNV